MKKRVHLKWYVIMLCVAACMLAGCHKHEFSEATCVASSSCIKCGEFNAPPLGHEYATATCTEPETCVRCGNTKGAALGHNYTEATCTQLATCTRCGDTKGVIREHEFSKNCTGEQTCSLCGETRKAPGHDFKEATCTESKVCKVCGETEGEPLGHQLVAAKCSRCDYFLGSLENIQEVCDLRAKCEDDPNECIIDVDTDHNPYDVVYDYGEDYNLYVSACDWSLVFDADYYIKAYPMLAYLYHNDKELLLEHFQTVGIHEGRQASSAFNVGAYLQNCERKVYDAFLQKYEGYYLYYMLNYEKEKEINTQTANNGKEVKGQYKNVLTYTQQAEYKYINQYRAEVDVADVEYSSELQAYANYRSYINVTENWDAHDWVKNNEDKAWDLVELFASEGNSMGENNVTLNRDNKGKNFTKPYYKMYYDSPEHYQCMVSPKYIIVGVSNTYLGNNNKLNTYKKSNKVQGAQFDVYLKKK